MTQSMRNRIIRPFAQRALSPLIRVALIAPSDRRLDLINQRRNLHRPRHSIALTCRTAGSSSWGVDRPIVVDYAINALFYERRVCLPA